MPDRGVGHLLELLASSRAGVCCAERFRGWVVRTMRVRMPRRRSRASEMRARVEDVLRARRRSGLKKRKKKRKKRKEKKKKRISLTALDDPSKHS